VYKPTLAELAAGVIPGGRGSMGSRGSSSGPSTPGSLSMSGKTVGGGSAKMGGGGAGSARDSAISFDHDDDDDVDDEEEEEEEEVLDPTSPDANIEKAVRHMRIALAGLQKSGAGLSAANVEPYDHRNCSDCSVVYDMANDCCMHIAAANFRLKQCSERMQKLAMYKEKMQEVAEILESDEVPSTGGP
jgi:hypothetical protein